MQLAHYWTSVYFLEPFYFPLLYFQLGNRDIKIFFHYILWIYGFSFMDSSQDCNLEFDFYSSVIQSLY